jgi:hypothetical protein
MINLHPNNNSGNAENTLMIEMTTLILELYKMVKSGTLVPFGNGVKLEFPEDPYRYQMDYNTNTQLKSRIEGLLGIISQPPLAPTRSEKIDKLTKQFLVDRVDALEKEVQQLKELMVQGNQATAAVTEHSTNDVC